MLDSRTLNQHLKGDTGRLASTYLAIILSLTIVFSGIIYAISSSQFDRPLPPRAYNGSITQFEGSVRQDLQDLFDQRASEARAELLVSLLFLNLAVLLGGALFSYFLARKTLEPIEAAMESQARFVSDASHELRTPLTVLQVTNEVALRKKKLTLVQAKDLIAYNITETIKLRNLSEALLGLARQEHADTNKTDISTNDILEDVIGTLEPLAKEHGIGLLVDANEFKFTANYNATSQIIRILLDNAIKYSPSGEAVTIKIEPAGSGAKVAIIDSGIGIPADQTSKIFDRFYRLDESRSSQHVEGSGIGLSIAKAIADRHGYEIHVKSERGHGSTFVLQIQ